MTIHIQPIPEPFLARVRHHGIDDQGQPVRRLVASGGEPCRDVLRQAQPGEALILASFSPFETRGPYREFGPVFVLAAPSSEDVRRNVLPVDGRYLARQFVLRAYDLGGDIFDAMLVSSENAQDVLDRFLERDDVDFVDARFAAHGCFACRIVRS